MTCEVEYRPGFDNFKFFQCNDLLATYEELKAKGVVFKKAPTKEFYGYEALFIVDSGNWFSLEKKIIIKIGWQTFRGKPDAKTL